MSNRVLKSAKNIRETIDKSRTVKSSDCQHA